ncbi:kinase-like protein [Auriscalpium vulgare]|uniref:Kinase-like protein n=1 Tax=Auriscalpium vulgare TaxID=40419 RepID=A0ACB8S3I0_9AGAM|nr:kinase-like protein [Auriscalpium vulgare]
MAAKIVNFQVTRPYRPRLSRTISARLSFPQPTMSSNVVGPDIAPSVPSTARSLSLSSLSTNFASHQTSTATTPPVLYSGESQEAEALVEGLRHVRTTLDARQYKSSAFAKQLLDLFDALRVPSWYKTTVTSQSVSIRKVSGSLTNAVFFVSSSLTSSRTLLLRIYGPSSGSLISRPRELHTLHVLSSAYRMGPRIYGTFENGRIEEYFDSVTLTASDIRDMRTSGFIGARMAELHGVDIGATEQPPVSASTHATIPLQIAAKKNVYSWLPPARHVLSLPSLPARARDALDLDVFQTKWETYMHWLEQQEAAHTPSPRVFCHNDAQYGNLLRLNKLKAGLPEHHQIIVVDFEYAAPNPAAFDIANHFHEWTADYHGATPHVLDPTRYPSLAQRRVFYRAYLAHTLESRFAALAEDARARELERLEQQVRAWSPASHAMWAVWGLVQAREDVEGVVAQPEFDYIGYARSRMAGFYRELQALGL